MMRDQSHVTLVRRYVSRNRVACCLVIIVHLLLHRMCASSQPRRCLLRKAYLTCGCALRVGKREIRFPVRLSHAPHHGRSLEAAWVDGAKKRHHDTLLNTRKLCSHAQLFYMTAFSHLKIDGIMHTRRCSRRDRAGEIVGRLLPLWCHGPHSLHHSTRRYEKQPRARCHPYNASQNQWFTEGFAANGLRDVGMQR